jgi:glucan phosphorylase
MPTKQAASTTDAAVEDVRTGTGSADLKQAVTDHLHYSLGRLPAIAGPSNYYRALAVRDAMTDLGQDLDVVLACEEEPGLGNGGLGRLAACYLDSLATLQCPAVGYGIRYEFGIFQQEIHDGWQTEITDKWLNYGNPWEIAKPEVAYRVNWGGHSEWYRDEQGVNRVRWIPNEVVKGTAYDTPIQGYRVNTCNTLRLWSSEAVESFDFQAFNTGEYYQAVAEKLNSETVTKVLYPNDEPQIGKRLRLAHLASVGSHAINGVAALHTSLLKSSVLKDFYDLWPERFSNKTNGVTPRRFVALSNPGLRELLNRTLGEQWLSELGQLRRLEAHFNDAAFRAAWRSVKYANKQRLAGYVKARTGIALDHASLKSVARHNGRYDAPLNCYSPAGFGMTSGHEAQAVRPCCANQRHVLRFPTSAAVLLH